MKNSITRKLCEGAMMVAFAQILSMLKIYELPQGGSITLAMLPIILFAVRWGLGGGLLSASVFGLLQLIFDGAYAWGWQSMVGDYLLAFAVPGLAGLARGRKHSMVWGTLIGCGARFLVHWAVGATVWAEYMPEEFFNMTMSSPWFYSALYNGSYMLPCTVLTLVVGLLLYRYVPAQYIRSVE